jgi:type II secretory pathway component GspD/PulD (secretin)
VKKSAALLLLMGLVALPVQAQDQAPGAAGSPASPSGQSGVKKARPTDDFVTLNFTNIDINALVKVMSELTRRNFILDERVTGKVTLMTPTKISPDEAYQVFLSALEIKNLTAVEDGKIIRIVPSSTARQSGLKVIQDGDMKGEGFVTKLVRMNFVNPQEIVRTITPLVTKDGSMIAYPATNSVIITDPVSNIRKIESLIHAMDVAAPEGKGKINVYYLKNASAEDIAKLMQALVSRLPVPPAGGAAVPAGPSTILEGSVTITADKATNSLIIVGSPGDFEIMKDVVQKLDIRRRQVYVEAAIIEMSLAKQRDLGFEFQVPINQAQFDAGKTIAVGGTNFGTIGGAVANGPAGLASVNGLAIGAVKGTFKFKGVEFLSIGALLHALQIDADVNVLSTPNILTMDNQKAEIMVGQNVPFPTGQTQNAVTGTGSLFNTIERKDVGIKLTLTPQIASDDNVRLDVSQEISDVVGASSSNPNGLITNKRSASTTVVVKDRQTMVIGGLIRDNETVTTSKVPFLGDIPILGWLFKSKSTRLEKTNLMIFITPYIIKNEGEASDLTQRKNDSLDDFRKEYRIEKKKGIESAIPPRTGGAMEQPAPETKPATVIEPSAPALPPVKPSGENETQEKPQPAIQPAPEQQPGSSPSTTALPPPATTGVPAEGAR